MEAGKEKRKARRVRGCLCVSQSEYHTSLSVRVVSRAVLCTVYNETNEGFQV
jgi:hypothetical protein